LTLDGVQQRTGRVFNLKHCRELFMKEALLQNMAHMTYGIYVLTTRSEGTINGMIASWVSQVSYDPPLIMAAVHPSRYSHELLMRSGYFALHILAREQSDFLTRFKGQAAGEKFDALPWSDGVTGCPILADCIGCLECRVIQHLAPGNHTLFVGEVVNAVFNAEKTPLCTLDYDGCYLGKA
jgi:flavin reductase (DIM6/NTAB) family NADH-FMN oxidoreductase RutF